MRQSVLVIIYLLFFSIPSDAQILYQCASPNGDTVFYVFGTCHYLPREAKIDTVLLGKLIRSSDVVFSELFVEDGDPSYKRVVSNLNELVRYKNNGSILDSITQAQYGELMNYYRTSYGVSKKEFKWATYYLPLQMDNRLRYSSRNYYSIDKILYSIARRSGKKINNLDNEELLYNAHTYKSSEFDIRWLLSKVEGKNVGQFNDDTIIQLYLQQDTAGINRHYKPGLKRRQVLLEDRNKHWFTIFEQKAGRTNFIYCGLAHLISDEFSLLNYFRNRKFSVRAIEIDIAQKP
jgi:uncharacterized protein YbaP (TraB family)